MKCPYCDQEMRPGVLNGDGRSAVRWKEGSKKTPFFDMLAGIGKVKGVKYKMVSFHIDAWYCKDCRKIIMDAEVEE
ncbi:MAG: hypothetical protein IJB69_10440 [Clostridia bacterium]|nr:hypothetical protein [Clostridia bacterium]